MSDQRVEALARLVVGYSIDVQPGQLIAISGTPLAAPLIRAAYREVLARGGHPALRVTLPGINELLLRHGSDEQLQYIAPEERLVPELADGALVILSDANTKALSGIDPERQQMMQRARRDMMQHYLQRSAEGTLKWCLTLFPTEAYAQDAEMSLTDYEDFVFGAGLLREPDPIAAWQALSAEQQRLIDWIKGKQEVRIQAAETDLTLNIGGRTFINADGHYNFPDGEIFTAPVEDSVNGRIRFSFPSVTNGREVEDIRLVFEQGKVIEASAAKNEEFLLRMLDADDGARYLGEFAFGTNRSISRFTGNILFDEKLGGTVHLAIGSSYPETGGKNQSAIHWDMICDLRDQSEVTVDGELFIRDGEFVV